MARRLTFKFLRTEAASASFLAVAALAALIAANSPLAGQYFGFLKSEQALHLGPLVLSMTAADWVKEGLMSVFFLVVGLEIKHEILRGELSDPRKLATPVIAAIGGMLGPVAVYLTLAATAGAPAAGWPIPTATDIAFALGVLALVGRGLPSSLRIFLLTLAIVDDLGAIVLIGLLYSGGTDWSLAGAAVLLLVVLGGVAQRMRVPTPVWALGFATAWWLTVQAGLSTSLMAVAFATIVPLKPRREDGQSPLQEAMHDLHPWNAFLVLPIFAFAKAGVSMAGLTLAQALAPLVVAIALGLFLGKQVGVMVAVWLVTKLRIGARPEGATWLQLYGVSLLCGIGFTMSLFIGALAFPGDAADLQTEVKLGVLGGSLLSAIAAVVVLRLAGRPARAAMAEAAA
ncbi:Na+/H+ antiporter NhaA [Phenylobacterium sp. J367]|uniref:Na+/H+ antiporter NhaA n=1 Tax=Phenylobacterium sp. J367 TaxID=2898435 RepID=UPI0021519BA0|nr:Na+/H+ antiporter NhaA [Phenylobacterium sp. J367]MCR5878743.1 Na+/H+ antiporter NhaA [Phenylobacterium sp. J367]